MTDPKYGWEHQKVRAQWAKCIATHGRVLCRRAANGTCRAPSPWITTTDEWDLGHPDETCALPTAPEHRRKCNRATNLRDRRAARVVAPVRASRRWLGTEPHPGAITGPPTQAGGWAGYPEPGSGLLTGTPDIYSPNLKRTGVVS